MTSEVRIRELTARIDEDGGAVLGTYNDPFGGTPVLLVALPIDASSRRPSERSLGASREAADDDHGGLGPLPRSQACSSRSPISPSRILALRVVESSPELV